MPLDTHKKFRYHSVLSIDSFPVPVCDNIRISRCKIYQDEAYRGYVHSKWRYFYGLRIHLIVTETGKIAEFTLAPGSWADIRVFRNMDLDLPKGAIIGADKAYTDYAFEDMLETLGIHLEPHRKKKLKTG